MSSKIRKIKYWQFFKASFVLGCTAFGGPQIHIPLFIKRLTQDKKFINAEDLLDINAFCNILPGPSTTQTLAAVGFKIGGPALALIGLLAWILPGAIIMSVFALTPGLISGHTFRFIPPMTAAFFVFSIFKMLALVRPDWINYAIVAILTILTFLLQSPLIFPIAIVASGWLSARFGSREFIPNRNPFGPVNWSNLVLFLIIIGLLGLGGFLLSANENSLGISKPIILFENTYRMGSLTFGGGNSLAAMAIEQYVEYNHRLSHRELNIGIGLVQGIPGPNFNLATYFNGVAMRNYGYSPLAQIAGCAIGMVAVFLPGLLLIFFGYPLWAKLKGYPIVQRSLDGIFAASVGFIGSAALLINSHFFGQLAFQSQYTAPLAIYSLSLLLLFSKKVSPPIVVLLALTAGMLIP